MDKRIALLMVLIIILAVLLATVFLLGIFWDRGGRGGNSNINQNDDLVEYNDSYGKICPLDVKFLGKKGANLIKCECPTGYELESDIIGYEECYGPGTECPILSSGCEKVEVN